MKRVTNKEFFEFLFEDNEGYLCIVEINRNPEGQPKKKEVKQHFFLYPAELEGALTLADAKKERVDLYFAPFLLDEAKRRKQFITDTVAAWADGDECPVEALRIQPSALVRSSQNGDGDKFHFYWKFAELQPALVGENISKRIAYAHADEGMDRSGWDLTQLLRIPNTYNHKYTPPVKVSPAVVDTSALYSIEHFENEYEQVQEDTEVISVDSINLPNESAKELLTKYKSVVSPRAVDLFIDVPDRSWSEPLYELQCTLFEAGLSKEEVFVIVRESACNKYARDHRPEAQLWREVQKVEQHVQERQEAPPSDSDFDVTTPTSSKPPELLTTEQRELVKQNPTFVEKYTEWAKELGDAAHQYHPVGAFVILSSIMCGTVRIPTSFGTLIPNMWFMILADTTLTRKSTAMDIAMDLLFEADEDVMLATDGSIEGLMTAMAGRSGRPSVFLRDEVTGLIDAISKKEYMAGMMEMLTKMYDGRPMKRILRRETINVNDPRLVFFGGGIRNKMMDILSHQHVSSGFLPRFVFVTAESDITKIKPIGPPTEKNTGGREDLVEYLVELHDKYNNKPTQSSNSSSAVKFPTQWPVELTEDAWYMYNAFEVKMLDYAMSTLDPSMMTPMMDRLSKSGLKAAALIAASKMPADKIVVTELEMLHAFSYIEQWLKHTIYIVNNIGKSYDEKLIQKLLDAINGNNGLLRSELMRRNYLSARDADNVFLTMEQRGLIRREKKGGRGERIYSTNSGRN